MKIESFKEICERADAASAEIASVEHFNQERIDRYKNRMLCYLEDGYLDKASQIANCILALRS